MQRQKLEGRSRGRRKTKSSNRICSTMEEALIQGDFVNISRARATALEDGTLFQTEDRSDHTASLVQRLLHKTTTQTDILTRRVVRLQVALIEMIKAAAQ